MKQPDCLDQRSTLGGYLSIPHELLHVLGYRLVGRRCRYRWGDLYVTPVGSMTRWRSVAGLLFPFIVCALLFLICAVVSGFAYRDGLRSGSFFWFIFWTVLALSLGSYAGLAAGDLRQAYLLIFNKPWYSWTPFDIFYWPLVDWFEIRRNLEETEQDDQPD